MSTTTCNVRGKQNDGTIQKVGPMKATIPMASLLRPLNNAGVCVGGTTNHNIHLYNPLSSPMRLISPDHNSAGHRSPGSANYFKGKPHLSDNISFPSCIRRTASLDALYMKPSWKIAHQLQLQHQLQQQAAAFTILQLDKATQTDESSVLSLDFVSANFITNNISGHANASDSLNVIKTTEKIVRQRLQRVQRGGEHSVSSQTLSPIHTSPLSIPPRPSCSSQRPMRSSVEGLNQEIEKLVLIPGQPHTCRPESSHFSRGIPEGHRAPLADILQSDTRSVNTQTPNRDHLSSDESQSTSPDDNVSSSGGTEASPRINRFLARLPPDGCEKVCLKSSDADQVSTTSTIFKPTVGFKLRPSLGSAFQPLQPIVASMIPSTDDNSDNIASNDAKTDT